MLESINEGRHQVKRKYGEHPRIRINEKGATVRDTIINYVGKNYVREQDLNNYLIRLEEDRDSHAKINKVTFFKRNQKFFKTFERNGEKYISLSKYGQRVLELIKQDKKTPPAINESTLSNIPSLKEWVSVSELNELVNEAREPKSWDTMFATNVLRAYEDGDINIKDPKAIEKWDIDYNSGNKPNPAFATKEIIDYAIKTGKKPDGSKLEESEVNEKSIKGWFSSNIDSFRDEKEYMKAGKKAGFSKKELQAASDDFEQGGEACLESEVHEDMDEKQVLKHLEAIKKAML